MDLLVTSRDEIEQGIATCAYIRAMDRKKGTCQINESAN
jgi:hypothetical protein